MTNHISVDEFAKKTGWGVGHIYRAIYGGQLRAEKIDGRGHGGISYAIPKQELSNFPAKCTTKNVKERKSPWDTLPVPDGYITRKQAAAKYGVSICYFKADHKGEKIPSIQESESLHPTGIRRIFMKISDLDEHFQRVKKNAEPVQMKLTPSGNGNGKAAHTDGNATDLYRIVYNAALAAITDAFEIGANK